MSVAGPDGKLVVDVELKEGKPFYKVRYNDQLMIQPSPLGLVADIGDFSSGLTFSRKSEVRIDETYTLGHCKAGQVHYEANELTCSFTNTTGGTIDIILRTGRNDVALSYRISHKDKVRAVIMEEMTGFQFGSSATTFITAQSPAGSGWMATKPSYEEKYTLDEPVGRPSEYRLGYTFPALFRCGTNGWVLLSETGVTSKYVATHLSEGSDDGLYKIAFPPKDQNGGYGDSTVQTALPASTSWKTITVGNTLKPIVETTVSYDVVKPLFEPTEKYPSGRATWSWLLWQDGSINMDDQKKFIDLAAALKFEFVLVDNWWDSGIGRERMPELTKYAASKGVSVILWYNTNGGWNDAPQTPQDCMDTAPARHKEMAWLKSAGVKGIKVDFFGGDKQPTMKLYEDILTDANLYGICVNFHGATLPRGWEKMYPNHMTSEAVAGSEMVYFVQEYADIEARTSTLLPFTRNTTAAMDYGPVMMQRNLSRDDKSGKTRMTTDTFQLATAVIYQSGIQHYGLTPLVLEQQPEHVLNFLRKVPAGWDETRYLDGYPGKFVVLARRSGNDWYVAATCAESEPEREITIKFPEIKGRETRMLYDQPDGTTGVKDHKVSEDGEIRMMLKPRGGAVILTH
jgi:hypothetical protein